MRPKTVALVLLAAVGVLAILVVLKGMQSRPEAPPEAVIQPEPVKPEPATVVAPPPRPPITNNIAWTPEEEREARIRKEVSEVDDAVVDGNADPKALPRIVERLTNPDLEVRMAAIEGLKLLSTRAAIPALKTALDRAEDSHEKAAILETIHYLELPTMDELANMEETGGPNQGSEPKEPANPVPPGGTPPQK
jgi:hypothetical protein